MGVAVATKINLRPAMNMGILRCMMSCIISINLGIHDLTKLLICLFGAREGGGGQGFMIVKNNVF